MKVPIDSVKLNQFKKIQLKLLNTATYFYIPLLKVYSVTEFEIIHRMTVSPSVAFYYFVRDTASVPHGKFLFG